MWIRYLLLHQSSTYWNFWPLEATNSVFWTSTSAPRTSTALPSSCSFWSRGMSQRRGPTPQLLRCDRRLRRCGQGSISDLSLSSGATAGHEVLLYRISG